VFQGTVSSVDATTLTLTGAGWTTDQFQDLVLVPNVAWDYNNYRITGNTGDTLTVAGSIDLTRVNPGDTFAIIYGKLIKDTINTPSSGAKTVRLFDSTGTDSFADGDATYDGVCEVCHTQTTYHRNDVSGDHTHNAGIDCMTCHQHTKGFNVACDICHGNPPVVNTATGGPDGLADDPGVTGSSTAGVHNVHVNTKSFACTVCHYNSAGTGATHNNSLTVTMGFYLFGGAQQGGSYDGQSAVSYNTTTTAPVTSVSSNNNKTCSNIYCHSTGQSTVNGGVSTPIYTSPVWDDPASAVCGTCHKVSEGAGLSSGSHEAHLETTGVAGCGECHTGAENNASAYNSVNHVNAAIDVANSYDKGGSPGNGYGKCSTGRCHDDGTGNPKLTPQWGNPGGGCSECHAEVPATGSHVKHVTTTQYNAAVCGDCHDGAVRNTTAPAQHLDGNVDVYDASAGDLGYSQDVAKGGAPYDNCSTAYCHGTGQASDGGPSGPTYATVTWGDTAACGSCHNVTPVGLTSGSHTEHLGNPGVNGCGDCHTGAADNGSSYNSTDHVDGQIDVSNSYTQGGTPGNGYGTCSVAACHGTLSPTWGTDFTGTDECTKCHGTATAAPAADDKKAPPKDLAGHNLTSDDQVGAHQAHLQSSLSSNVACIECHTVPANIEDAGHINDGTPGTAELNFGSLASTGAASPDYTGGVCSSVYCHGGAMPGGTSDGADKTPTWNNDGYLNGTPANDCTKCHGYPPSGIGAHSGKGPTDCITCHNYGINAAGTGFTDASNHINGSINGGGDNCGDCHSAGGGSTAGTTPDSYHAKHVGSYYVNGYVSSDDYGNTNGGTNADWLKVNVNASTGEYQYGCGNCHPVDPANHQNGTVNITLNSSHGGTVKSLNNVANDTTGYSQTEGTSVTCSAAYCHSDAKGNYMASPDWYGSGFAGNECSSCHNDPPMYANTGPGTANANSHYTPDGFMGGPAGHLGIHYDNVYTGTIGLLSQSGGVGSGAGHGDPNTSTTMACTICHAGTVDWIGDSSKYSTLSYAGTEFDCSVAGCHDGTTAFQNTAGVITNKNLHVNGSKDIVMMTSTLKSKSQLRDAYFNDQLEPYGWHRNNGYKQGTNSYDSNTPSNQYVPSTKTCVTSCHIGESVRWGDPNVDCLSCHSDM
jgi:predicted CxxxxCH...CXXCH cytochrome family protein